MKRKNHIACCSLAFLGFMTVSCATAPRHEAHVSNEFRGEINEMRERQRKLEDKLARLEQKFMSAEEELKNLKSLALLRANKSQNENIVVRADNDGVAPETVHIRASKIDRDIVHIKPSQVEGDRVFSAKNGSVEQSRQDQVHEIVVSEEQKRKYFGKSYDRATTSAQAPKRKAYDNVVTDDRLPVGSDNTRVTAKQPLEYYRRGIEYYRTSKFSEAVEAFEKFLQSGEAGSYEDNAYFWIGESHAKLGDKNAAAKAFETVIDRFPDEDKVPDAMLKLAMLKQKENRNKESVALLDKIIQTYPNTAAAREASVRQSQLLNQKRSTK